MAEQIPRALLRAHADIDRNRLWKARDRIEGWLATHPADQDALDLLGEVFYKMGDLPRAGACWYLTERQGSDVDAALDALDERHGRSPLSLLTALRVRARSEHFPPRVRDRLARLAGPAAAAGYRSSYPPVTKLRQFDEWPPPEPPRSVRTRIMEPVQLSLIVLLTVGVWLVGAVSLVWFLLT